MDTLLLSKLLPTFAWPLGLGCFLLVAGLAAHRWRRVQAALLVATLGVLWVPSTRWAAGKLLRSLEFEYLATNDLPVADAIVVLGGCAEPALPPRTGVEIGASGDRLFRAAELFLLGKAPIVVVSGGRVPWSDLGGSEAEDMSVLLERLGVPREAILKEERSRNTRENALQTKRLLSERGLRRILLVTSARHLPRSVPLFERAGLDVTPVPTDFILVRTPRRDPAERHAGEWLFQIVPEVQNLAHSTDALREHLALFYYRIRGLVD